VKWQETWEPEERMMNICAPLINEFWKEYYQRTQQQNNLQQQTTLDSTESNQLKQLVQQNAKDSLQQNQHLSQHTLVPFSQSTSLDEQTTQAVVNVHGSKDTLQGDVSQQNSLVASIPESSQTQRSNHQDQEQQQAFQSVSQVYYSFNLKLTFHKKYLLSGETPDFSLGLGHNKIGMSEIFSVPYHASS